MVNSAASSATSWTNRSGTLCSRLKGVSSPIRSVLRMAFLILKVEEKHKAGQATFEEVEQEVMNELIQPKFQPQVREYLTKLRL